MALIFVNVGESIQAAINSANPGDTVIVAPGTFNESVNVNKDITLRSFDGNTTLNGQGTSSSFSFAVMITADGASLGGNGTGFTINAGASETAAVYIDANTSNVLVSDNQINGNAGASHQRQGLLTGGGLEDVLIENNVFGGGASQLVYVNGSASVLNASTNVDFLGNTFSGSATGAVLASEATGSEFSNNTFSGGGTAAIVLLANGNIIGINDFSSFGSGTDLSVRELVVDLSSNPTAEKLSLLNFGPTVDVTYTGNGLSNTITGRAGNDTLAGAGGDDVLNGNGGNDTFDGGSGADTLNGGSGTDTATYSIGATIAIDGSGRWTVTSGGATDTLTGVERVVVGSKIYLLVDKTVTGGFQSVQSAVDSALGGETILIAPGTYTETSEYVAGDNQGLHINKPNLTLQGVSSTGTVITSAADAKAFGPVIVAGAQNMFGANHWVDVNGDGTRLTGLQLRAGPETDNKLLEIWADGVTVENSFVNVNAAGGYSFAAAIYLNDNGDAGSDWITSYTISNNILTEGVIIANGVGTPGPIGATQLITNNVFEGAFDPVTGAGIYDQVVINGQVPGIGWLLEPSQTPTISGNTFNDTAPFILRGTDGSAANLPTAAQVATILANNTASQYTYVTDANGNLRLADNGGVLRFAVTDTIDTLNLGLDATSDNVFGGQRIFMQEGDTVRIQSGPATQNSQIMVDDLTILANANSADLNLTLATTYADGSTIAPADQVLKVSLADYAAGSGANVDVTGNAFSNVIVGNSGANQLSGGGGSDTLVGGLGADTLNGDADNDLLQGGSGADALNGGTGVDTALYTGAVGLSQLTSLGGSWQVAAGAEGTDTLTGVEVLDAEGVGGARILLVGSGGFASIQAAVDASSDGDTILVAAGTYNESVTVNKAVSLVGAFAGTDARSRTGNSGEAVITGGVHIAADNVSLDGFKITGNDFRLALGLDRDTGLLIGGNNSKITNTILDGDGQNGSDVRPFSTFGGVTGIDFNHNVVTDWAQGGYVVIGSTGTFSATNFANNGNGIVSEATGIVITGNSFLNSLGAHIALAPFTSNVDVSQIVLADNTHDFSRIVSIFPNGAAPVTIQGSELGDRLAGEGYTGPFIFSGGNGNDRAVGTAASDTLNGDAGNDSLEGGGGNDTLVGGAGQDVIDGGLNNDTAVFSGTRSNYRVDDLGGGSFLVIDLRAGVDGSDIVHNVEKFQFSDVLLTAAQVGNDAPVNTLPGPQSTSEDTSLAISGVSVFDIEGESLTTTLSVSSGTLSVNTGGGNVTGNGTGFVSITGTASAINAALAGLSYTGSLNFNGTDTLNVVTADPSGATDSDSVSIAVTAVNDAPVASADAVNGTEDTSLVITAAMLTGNDSDGDPEVTQPLTITSVTSVGGGTATLNQDGTVTFTPTANFNGAATFTYTVSDGVTTSGPATVTVNLAAVDDAPIAAADALNAVEDTPVTFSAAALVGNDDDGDPELNQALTIASVTSGVGGTVVLNGNGTVTFTPNANFNGPASFTYRVSDGTTLSAPVSVTINVAAVNDAPVGPQSTQTVSVEQASTLFALGIVAPTDPDGDPLTFTVTALPNGGTVYLGQNSITVGQTLNAAQLTSLVYDAPVNNSGALALQFSFTDGNSAPQPLSVNLVVTAPADNNYTGGSGADRLDGAAGNDVITGLGGNDSLIGSIGNDTLYGGAGTDSLFGGTGNDAMLGGADADFMDGGADNDVMSGEAGGDNMYGGAGSDIMYGNADADYMQGDAGNDTLYGGSSADVLVGGAGDDIVISDDSDAGFADVVYAGEGNDLVFGGGGNDTLRGDDATGPQGNDTLYGDDGNDILLGFGGNDTLFGGAGFDVILGDAGSDYIDGGAQADILAGGAGNDFFILRRGEIEGDQVADFASGDQIILTGFGAGANLIQYGNGVFAVVQGGVTETFTANIATLNVGTDILFG